MTATPTSIVQLEAALNGALPTRYRPCVPAPTRDGKIHISVALTGSTSPNTPTTAFCGAPAVIIGSSVVPDFVLCTSCWEDFLAAA
jgi:predicted transcriptional regulator